MPFESDEERLVAEQALLNYRELKRVMKHAPHGKGMAVLLLGESSPQHQSWAEDQILQLIEHGPVRYLKTLNELLAVQSGAEQSKAIGSLLGYLKSNLDSLWYRQRLAEGRPIGTGLIEGACKTIVSNRLKLNNARWADKHAEQMGTLRCLDYSGLWSDFWTERAA